VLACGRGAALSHGSAAALLGLRRSSARMHVTVPRNGPHSRGHLVVHRVRRLHPADVTTVAGIRVTTWARTALDLAEQLRLGELRALFDQAEALQIFDLHDLEACMRRNPGRATAPIREALDLDAPSVSELQRRFLVMCRELGLPEPQREVPLGAYHADFFWPHANLAVETDGRSFHDRRAAFESDRARDVATALRRRLAVFRQGSLPLSLS
jgi:hypothetical protein